MILSLIAALSLTSGAPSIAPSRIDWFRKDRIGMFIHWGPVSLEGTEIGWSRGDQVPVEVYDNLYKRFNPVEFNAEKWMELAKEVGFKYIVPTAKHHDGFCLWPSKQTDYTIANTPFKRDIMGEIAKAARKNGLDMCSYYSILDWHNPLYAMGSPGGQTVKPNPDMTKYMDYVKAQLTEIETNYKVKMFWFDGQWEAPYTPAMAADLRQYLFKLNPNLVVNNRVGKLGSDGDYDTPEQHVGSFQRGRPWETCMTICQQWAYKPNDTMKSLDEIVSALVETVTGDGNFLLNVGPMPNGEIEPRQVARLKELGAWLHKNGESIYGTRGGPFINGKWGGSTCKGNVIYLHLLHWNGEPIPLPALNAKIKSVKSISGRSVNVSNADGKWTVTSTPGTTVPTDTIVKINLDQNAVNIPVVQF